LVKKPNFIEVKIIDGRPLFFGNVTNKTASLKIFFVGHFSLIVFNIVKIPSTLSFLGFYWLEKYDPFID